MNKTRLFSACMLGLFLILSAGMTSAYTLVSGIVYDADHSNVINGANVIVAVGSNKLQTYSLSDGSYAVVFTENLTGTIGVSASTSAFKGSASGTILDTGLSGEPQKFSVVSLALTEEIKKPSSGGGKKWTPDEEIPLYQCGNGVCDSGENSATCPLDCSAVQEVENLSLTNEEETDNSSGNSFLTGAAITGITDFVKSGAGITSIGAIFLVLVGAIAFVSIRKSKLKKVSP